MAESQELANLLKRQAETKDNRKDSSREAANSLTSYFITILELAQLEGMKEDEMGEMIKQTIIDLKDVRQNLLRFRKVQMTEVE